MWDGYGTEQVVTNLSGVRVYRDYVKKAVSNCPVQADFFAFWHLAFFSLCQSGSNKDKKIYTR